MVEETGPGGSGGKAETSFEDGRDIAQGCRAPGLSGLSFDFYYRGTALFTGDLDTQEFYAKSGFANNGQRRYGPLSNTKEIYLHYGVFYWEH